MSSNQSPSNVEKPEPGGSFGQSYASPPPEPGFKPGSSDQKSSSSAPLPGASAIYGSVYPEDPARNEVKGIQFSEKSIRMGFIRKVYLLLMCQLILTFGIVAMINFILPIKNYVKDNFMIFFLVAFAISIVTVIIMCCSTTVRRKSPMNLIFLFIFTLAEGFFMGIITTVFYTEEILFAFGMTIVICFSLTVFAFQTKVDFTGLHTVLFVCLVELFIIVPLMICFSSKMGMIGIGAIGTTVFSFYLIYDTQLIIGGNHSYSISPEEYVFATLSIYLDVINIFIYILEIIGGR